MSTYLRGATLSAVLFVVISPVAAQNVLVFDDNSEDQVAQMACAAAGYTCTVAGETDFTTQLTAGGWDLVVMDMPSNYPDGGWIAALETYIAGGGSVVYTDWYDVHASQLADDFQVSLGSAHNNLTTYQWNGHPLFTSPESVPTTLTPPEDNWGDNGFYLEPAAEAEAAAGFTAAPQVDQAAIVIGNGGCTIFNGFLFDDYYDDAGTPVDVDTDGQADIVELVINEMALALECGGSQQVPGIPTTSGLGAVLLVLLVSGIGILILRHRLA